MSIESRIRRRETVFGHWQVDKLLGQGSGGKSAVFLLKRTDSFEEECALKVINLMESKGSLQEMTGAAMADYRVAIRSCRDNAMNEVRLMANLRGSSNIVDYLDHEYVDWVEDDSFGLDMLIRMEYLTPLRSAMVSRANQSLGFTEEEIRKIGLDICSALSLCREQNILHRDIKPENIFVNSRGDYKLGDFGISRILDVATVSMASFSTPEYAAPEQLRGQYDSRADIYSLGLVLYELANGMRMPFAQTRYLRQEEVMRRQSGEALPAPSNVGSRMAAIILKACAFQADDRYQSAEELAEALRGIKVQSEPAPMEHVWRAVDAVPEMPYQPPRHTAPGQGPNTIPSQQANNPNTIRQTARNQYPSGQTANNPNAVRQTANNQYPNGQTANNPNAVRQTANSQYPNPQTANNPNVTRQSANQTAYQTSNQTASQPAPLLGRDKTEPVKEKKERKNLLKPILLILLLLLVIGGGAGGFLAYQNCFFGHQREAAPCVADSKCARCGQVLAAEADHVPGEAQKGTVTEATCYQNGSYLEIVRCTVCDAELSGTTVILPAAHQTETHAGQAATCKAPGWEPYETCAVCGYSTYQAIPMLEHTWMDATCTVPQTCSACEETQGEAKGHDWGIWTAENPDPCAEECTEVRTCAVCEEQESRTVAKPANHSWLAATCTEPQICSVCGETTGEPNGHSWEEWATLQEPTCTKEGTKTRACIACTETERDTIPMIAHTWVDDGTGTYTCTVCRLSNSSVQLNQMKRIHEAGLVTPDSGFWGQNAWARKDVANVVFTHSADPAGDALDLSAAGDGSILAWMEDGTLYVYSASVIYLPDDSAEMFRSFTGLQSITFNNMLNTTTVTSMRAMFQDCASLTGLDLSGLSTINVSDMSAMFSGCTSLTELNLTDFNTARVTDMSAMFSDCMLLTHLDLSSFRTDKVTRMTQMFSFCESLTELNLMSFNAPELSDAANLTTGCARNMRLLCAEEFFNQLTAAGFAA